MQDVASDADGSNLIASMWNKRLWTSADYGTTWTERQPAGNIDVDWGPVASDSTGTHLVAGTRTGDVWVSSNSGSTWTKTHSKIGSDDLCYAVASSADGSIMVTGIYNGRLYTSSNFGASWVERNPAGDVNTCWRTATISGDGNTIIAGTGSLNSEVIVGRLYVSHDAGVTWTETQPAGPVDREWFDVAVSSDGTNAIVCTISDLNSRVYTTPGYSINVTDSPYGGGYVARSPSLGIFALNTVVTITAQPAPGYEFVSWSGDASGTNISTTVTMDAQKNVTATFAPLHPASGSGTFADPYIIMTRADLECINSDVTTPFACDAFGFRTAGTLAEGHYYKLGTNIDLAGENWSPLGAIHFGPDYEGKAFNVFMGHLDGNGHTISNMTLDITDINEQPSEIGFFAQISGNLPDAIIQNLIFTNASLDVSYGTKYSIGFLAGETYDAKVTDCSVTGTVTINEQVDNGETGGLFGDVTRSIIENCHGNVTMNVNLASWGPYNVGEIYDIGAIAGWVTDTSTLINCTGTLSLNGQIDGAYKVFSIGSLVGALENPWGSTDPDCMVTDSHGTIHIDISFPGTNRNNGRNIYSIGGLVGESERGTSITQCSASGTIKVSGVGADYKVFDIGGLIGQAGQTAGEPAIHVTRSYATTNINIALSKVGDLFDIGGFAGEENRTEAVFTDCYALGNIDVSTSVSDYSPDCIWDIAGFIGSGGSLTHCYSAGLVAAPMGAVGVGGLCGTTNSSFPVDVSTYWDTTTSLQTISDKGTGLTTAPMYLAATFTGWDFATIWTTKGDTYYPTFQWDIPAVTYTLTPHRIGTGGTVQNMDVPVEIHAGDTVRVQYKPSVGYSISDPVAVVGLVSGTDQTHYSHYDWATGFWYIDVAIPADNAQNYDVNVMFETPDANYVHITATSIGGGSVTPADEYVKKGSTVYMNVVANGSNTLQSFTDNGMSHGGVGTTYDIVNAQEDHAIVATFSGIVIYTVHYVIANTSDVDAANPHGAFGTGTFTSCTDATNNPVVFDSGTHSASVPGGMRLTFSFTSVDAEHYLYDVDVNGTQNNPVFPMIDNGFGKTVANFATPATKNITISGDTTVTVYFQRIGDLNIDGSVGILDLNIMCVFKFDTQDPMSYVQAAPLVKNHASQDIDRDGFVALADISAMLSRYGLGN